MNEEELKGRELLAGGGADRVCPWMYLQQSRARASVANEIAVYRLVYGVRKR